MFYYGMLLGESSQQDHSWSEADEGETKARISTSSGPDPSAMNSQDGVVGPDETPSMTSSSDRVVSVTQGTLNALISVRELSR